jgi:predicted deacylase
MFMPVSDYFGGSYAKARARFLAEAQAAGAKVSSYELPQLKGPENEELFMDVAVLGPATAERALLVLSGTHGVEGFCGSGCQVGYLADELHEALPAGSLSILVHAVNPHGFAWLRRVNEDHVDLNRNFRDFSQPLPDSSAYEEVHDWLLPEDWDGPARQADDLAIQGYIKNRGFAALQAAVSGGQYTRKNGLFYGGDRETWSNRTLRQVLADQVPATVKALAAIDLHTGLGPTGYGELIYLGPPGPAKERVCKWYGPEVKDPYEGSSVSAVVTGSLADGLQGVFPGIEVTAIALEFGTQPVMNVLTALRADHWLHAVEGRQTPLREAIKRQIRDAFYVDQPAWRAAVYGRTADIVLRAGRGLASAG